MPELEWFANVDSLSTQRAYRIEIKELRGFADVERPKDASTQPPPSDTLKGKRDRAILATFFDHALRCWEFMIKIIPGQHYLLGAF
jgi:hypothetical protein